MQHFNLYKGFAKKENSTKQPPSGTLTLGVQGIFKEPCSVLNPVLKIERLALDAVPYDYNYARYIEGDRYYFIEDWVWADGLWEVHMKEDVLATFKTEIGTQSEYILRTDSTTNFNGDICDTTYPSTTDIVTTTTNYPAAFSLDISVGCYIVGVISGSQLDAVGAISYFAMTSAQFGALKQALLTDTNLRKMDIIDAMGVQIVNDVSKEILKTLYNPFQYIVSCMWFPFPVSAITSTSFVNSISIGWWDYDLQGYQLYAQTLQIAESPVNFEVHPQATNRGNYLNYAPYSKRTLVGRYGTVAIDSAIFDVGDSIDIDYFIDLITGKCRTQIGRHRPLENNTYRVDVFAQREFLLGVPIQLAQVGVDYLGATATALGSVNGTVGNTISGFLSGGVVGAVTGAIGGVANGIYNTLQTAMPQVETSGTNGSFLAPRNNTKMVSQFYKIVDEDIAHRGRPLCEIRTINTLSGFILCAEGDMDISCYDNERKEITRFLTTGFFWE